MDTRFGYIPIAVTLESESETESLIERYAPALEQLGGARWPADALDEPVPLLLVILTGGTEQEALRLWANREASAPGEPLSLLAHPGNNSLPAAMEVLAWLQQEGASGRILYLAGPDDREGLGRLEIAVRDLEVRTALQGARIGLVGEPSGWLVASTPDPAVLHGTWGPEVVSIALDELYGALQAVRIETAASLLRPLVSGAAEVREPSPTELEDVVRVYVALRGLVQQHRLDAISLRCFDLVSELATTGCFAVAQLNDDGTIAGCEGDLVSTTGMLWAYKLLEEVPWMANPVQLNPAAGTLWLAHCTVPRCLVSRYWLRSHFESGLGVGLAGELPRGPVTLLRIGGKAMNQLWLAEGDVVRSGSAENLCRTQAEVQLTRGEVGDLLHAPLGNHLVCVRGHHMDRLRAWWKAMIAPRHRCDC